MPSLALQVWSAQRAATLDEIEHASDFNRFEFSIWSAVDADHPRNPQRRHALEDLNRWRNAIAHSAFTPAMYRGGRPALQLSEVQDWRKACDGLARSFDA